MSVIEDTHPAVFGITERTLYRKLKRHGLS